MANEIKVFGTWKGDSLKVKAGYPTIQMVADGEYQITYVYNCAMAYFGSLMPAWHEYCPLDGLTDHWLTDLSTAPVGNAPGFIEVTAVYTHPDPVVITWTKTPGTVTRSANATTQRVPIDEPKLTTVYNAAEMAAFRAAKVPTVNLGAVQYNYMKVKASFTWSEANLTQSEGGADIGDTGSPDGMTSATAKNWMFTGKNIREQGDNVETSDQWTYNRLGWK